MLYFQKFFVLFLSLSILGCSNNREEIVRKGFDRYKGQYLLYVDKGNFFMSIYNRDLKSVVDYKIGYGLNPDRKPKLYSGDKRTPEGLYSIIEILSMDAAKNTITYKKLKMMNKVYFKAKEGHSKYGKLNIDLGTDAYGPRFFRIDYPNESDISRYEKAKKGGNLPLKNGKLPGIGSGIGIHGNNDEASIGHLCSSGCIRMYNNDIVELDKYIQIGTPVIISNK